MNKAAKKAGHDTKYGINKFSDLSKKEIHVRIAYPKRFMI